MYEMLTFIYCIVYLYTRYWNLIKLWPVSYFKHLRMEGYGRRSWIVNSRYYRYIQIDTYVVADWGQIDPRRFDNLMAYVFFYRRICNNNTTSIHLYNSDSTNSIYLFIDILLTIGINQRMIWDLRFIKNFTKLFKNCAFVVLAVIYKRKKLD